MSKSINHHLFVHYHSLSTGLSIIAALELLQSNGPNVVPKPRELTMWIKFLLCFVDGFNPILIVAAILAFLSWQPFCPLCTFNFALGIVLASIVAISGVLTFFQEVQASSVMQNFSSMVPPDCMVTRSGSVAQVPPASLVVGDIVHLQTGSRVPAEVRILKCSNLKVDKSVLTGEAEPFRLTSEPVKDTVAFIESPNIAFMGTTVVEGEGTGVVVATGPNTQLAKISAQVSGVKLKATTLQIDLNKFVLIIACFAFFWAAMCVIVWAGYLRVQHPSFMSSFALIANALGVLVALVPQGLPFALNIGLTAIARRLLTNNRMLMKQFSAIETLGSMSFLASDKTGTLTMNKMSVVSILVHDGSSILAADFGATTQAALGATAVFCSQSNVDTANKSNVIGGNGVDKALLLWAIDQDIVDAAKVNNSFVFSMPFSSTTKMAAVIVQNSKTRNLEVLVKGAPEYIIARCSTHISMNGTESPMTKEVAKSLQDQINAEAGKGCRVIVTAKFVLPTDRYHLRFDFQLDPEPNFPLDGLAFVSAFVVSDPCRPDVREAIEELRLAGIQIAMVTGDSSLTARAIAADVGIISPNSKVTIYNGEIKQVTVDEEAGYAILPGLKSHNGVAQIAPEINPAYSVNPRHLIESAVVIEGHHVSTMSNDGWNFVFAHQELVFARTTSEHKLMIVKEAQRRQYVVAVTGDGTNDAPALKRADIGLAMGSGSAVAMDAALAILLDDTFTSIPRAVEQGRLLFFNLRNVIAYQISAGCFGELIPVLATFFLGMPTPLNSLMQVLVSSTNDMFAGVALILEPGQSHFMKKMPRNTKTEPLVTFKLVGYSYFFYTILQTVGMFYIYFRYMYERGPRNDLGTELPADDDGSLTFPIGYRAKQLLGAWNWGLSDNLGADEIAAANVGSSVFFTAMIIMQWGHFACIRRNTPYFSDAIMNTSHSSDSLFVRLWKELLASPPRWQYFLAIGLGACVANLFNEVPAVHEPCASGSVPGRYWGMSIGWSLVAFLIGEIRKWFILLYPNSVLTKITEY